MPPYTELLLAYKKFLTELDFELSIMLKNPFIFDSIYLSGLDIEYLTPACPAKWITISGLYLMNYME